MRIVTKRTVQGLAAAAIALGGLAATTGTASAASDTYCRFGTCLNGWNYNGTATGQICNNQGSANDFYLWITNARTGQTLISTVTPRINPGTCATVYYNPVGTDPIQVYGRSGSNWSYGTDPIAAN
ncbi:hypothetical protein [Kitasatospora sp. NPDC101183]|uniref:hypothetical protein n=1 Tax=Kitasatospora sp. NPDC101183 TaxID=3364100 RepID=UPI0037F8B347